MCLYFSLNRLWPRRRKEASKYKQNFKIETSLLKVSEESFVRKGSYTRKCSVKHTEINYSKITTIQTDGRTLTNYRMDNWRNATILLSRERKQNLDHNTIRTTTITIYYFLDLDFFPSLLTPQIDNVIPTVKGKFNLHFQSMFFFACQF